MADFDLMDFEESLRIVNVPPPTIEEVISFWGSETQSGEWEGGIVMKMKSGKFAYLLGWCETKEGGYEDGAEIQYFDAIPDYKSFSPKERWVQGPRPGLWDEQPGTFNEWLAQ